MAHWDDVTTYEQLLAVTPDERSTHFRSSIVDDLTSMSAPERERVAEMSARMNERARIREDRLRGQAS